jgi:hypothetical protein
LTKLRRGRVSITQMRPKRNRARKEASKAETFKHRNSSKGKEEAQAQEVVHREFESEDSPNFLKREVPKETGPSIRGGHVAEI